MPIFKRKAYDKLIEWKNTSNGKYAILIEGARRVGKSTLAEEFAKNEYESHIIIDFSKASKNILNCFEEDISNLDRFFLILQTYTGVQLVNRKSVIVFDEVQLFPKARQAIKYLVADGRYDYIETGSLISIKKNVKDIVIPSEEKKLKLYPFDYEEFLWATGNNTYRLLKDFYNKKIPIGVVNRKLMRDFRIYMAVGGMPQAVAAYLEKKSFKEIDEVKRSIINLYEDDFKKIDASGFTSRIYKDVPAQLSHNKKRYVISSATGRKTQKKDQERLYDVIDSQTVLISYNVTKPDISLTSTKNLDSYKLYIADTGLFVTLMFIDRPATDNILYEKLLADKLPANLGYLYENVAAQMIAASGRELCYHTWLKKESTHYYEMDFLIGVQQKIVPIEIKSSATASHKSIDVFCEKYSQIVDRPYIFSQKDISNDGQLLFMPIYLLPFLLES
ncbi:hypothetical protein SAMN02910289_01698 [Lachnospiraceae bacterium RM5]|nr:hypothetical protein SAMN02910289_01698 [Lachnospiraceae bacterium RM5]